MDLYQDDGTARGSKEESKDGVFLSLSRRLPNLEDEIHPKGGRFVTPKILLQLAIKFLPYLYIF